MDGAKGGATSGVDIHVSVVANPAAAGRAARRRLARGRDIDDAERAELLWTIGRADRDGGRLEDSRRRLLETRAIAVRLGDERTFVGVSSSLSFTYMRLGELGPAATVLDEAYGLATAVERARIGAQRGEILGSRGQLAEGTAMLRKSCDEMRRLDDVIHEARHRAHLAGLYCEMDRYAAARQQLDRSVEIAERLDLDLLVAEGLATLGNILTLQGDLPGALRAFGNSEQRHREAKTLAYLPSVIAAHARALALAGLYDDAATGFEQAVALSRRQRQFGDLPEQLCQLAHVRLAQGDAEAARLAAAEAATMLVGQGRPALLALSRAVALEAQGLAEAPTSALADELDRTASEFDELGLLSDGRRAHLVAARFRVEAGELRGAVVTARLRSAVRRGRAVDQISLAYLDALRGVRSGERGASRRALDRGVRVAVSTQATFGGFEARARVAATGYHLTDLGARLAIDDGRPRELLRRIEATRCLMTRLPRIHPDDDEVSAPLLAELRRIGLRIRDPDAPPDERRRDEQRRIQIEHRLATRDRFRRAHDDVPSSMSGVVDRALEQLGDHQLLAHAHLDGVLYAVTVSAGRARLHELTRVDKVREPLQAIEFALHRLNRSAGSTRSRRAAEELLDAECERLGSLIVPPEVGRAAGPLVVVPTAALHDVPWNLLPHLNDRPVSVNASLDAWANADRSARSRAVPIGDRVAGIMAGPGLVHADAEVAEVQRKYARAEVLDGPAATTASCLGLLATSDVAHLACHGRFRADNPMFSSLELFDGRLVVHDIERLGQVPNVVVMSACAVGSSKALSGGPLLGLAAALTTFGASSVIAPLTPVHDQASVPAMSELHARMQAGQAPAEALAVIAKGETRATAGAFISLGA